MFRNLASLRYREDGQDLTEYALLIGLIVILAVGAITMMGTTIVDILSSISSSLNAVL